MAFVLQRANAVSRAQARRGGRHEVLLGHRQRRTSATNCSSGRASRRPSSWRRSQNAKVVRRQHLQRSARSSRRTWLPAVERRPPPTTRRVPAGPSRRRATPGPSPQAGATRLPRRAPALRARPARAPSPTLCAFLLRSRSRPGATLRARQVVTDRAREIRRQLPRSVSALQRDECDHARVHSGRRDR